ncbi:MAG: DUF433 domain-containing protein [Bifidobacteriaceae bacterium]|nr:DUF433 domain-containing protein [Bifidobacteriaceae bacterium]
MLTGASPRQLRNWANQGILVPEDHPSRPMVYSFRDLVALRSVVSLRAVASLQRIRKALENLRMFDFAEHLSEYRFAAHGKSIVVEGEDGFMDLVRSPGQYELMTLGDIYAPFTRWDGREVAAFSRPRPRLQVNARRLGGWPTLEDTRIGYDTVALALADGTIPISAIGRYYPGATEAAAEDAVLFDREVRAVRA